MKYLITLTPLEPFFFGGNITFGKFKDKEKSTYLVKSRYFPQQTALLGVIRKEMLIQEKFLTTKRNGEWVDSNANKLTMDTVYYIRKLMNIKNYYYVIIENNLINRRLIGN